MTSYVGTYVYCTLTYPIRAEPQNNAGGKNDKTGKKKSYAPSTFHHLSPHIIIQKGEERETERGEEREIDKNHIPTFFTKEE